MSPQESAAALVDVVAAVAASDSAYKASMAVAIVDQLIGSDPHALVRSIPGVPESLVESISDGLLKALEAAILARLGG